MLTALAFVPVEKVYEYFELLIETKFREEDEGDEFNAGKQKFLTYFENTYIGGHGRTAKSRRSLHYSD